MGKGSVTIERLRAHVLTAAERREREAKVQPRGRLEAMADGRIVEVLPEEAKPAEVARVPDTTWD